MSTKTTDSLRTHWITFVSHRRGSNLVLFKWFFHFLQVCQVANIASNFLYGSSQSRQRIGNAQINLSGIRLRWNWIATNCWHKNLASNNRYVLWITRSNWIGILSMWLLTETCVLTLDHKNVSKHDPVSIDGFRLVIRQRASRLNIQASHSVHQSLIHPHERFPWRMLGFQLCLEHHGSLRFILANP